MAAPSRLSKRLREVLGSEAAEDMTTWIEEMRADRAALLSIVQESERRLTDGILQGVALKIAQARADLVDRIANVKADLMLWSFVFWVGAVAAIAMLAGVLGR